MPCSVYAIKLCSGCEVCDARSFMKSSPKAQYLCLELLDGIDINNVTIGSNKKLPFKCPKSGHIFWICPKLVKIGHWCSFPCCGNQKLCENDTCEMCYKASFASSPFAKHWSPRNEVTPRQVFLNTHNKYLFVCGIFAYHEYVSQPGSITQNENSQCPYPCCSPGHQLCDVDDCQICYDASFASTEQSKYVVDKSINLRKLFKNSYFKMNFICIKVGHIFNASPIDVIGSGTWCPFPCCTSSRLCEDDNCETCFNASFASSDKAKYWSIKNDCRPRDMFLNSNFKRWFTCENGHDFDIALNSIKRGRWCSMCKIWKNREECLEIIERITGKIFIECRLRILDTLQLDGYNEELMLAFEYNGEQHYEYIPFFHNNDIRRFKKQQERDLRKIELCKNNNIFLIIIPYWIEDKETYITNCYEEYCFLRVYFQNVF